MPIKSLDELSEDPLPTRPVLSPQAKEWKRQAEEMLSDGRYQFAEDTILRMLTWVVESGLVTTKMQEALNNIYEGGQRGQANGERVRLGAGSRRYEGFRGGGR